MFRYILAILLINTCYHSLGNPVPQRISSALSQLEIHCENPFMNSLMKSKIAECSGTVPPLTEKQFQCLIFYDMSHQLCSAISTSQITLNEDNSAKINEEQDVNRLCETAKDWEFGNLSEFAVYKSTLEKVFKHPVTCGKVCGADELTSTDANFFCKFFNWGLGTLKTTATSQKTINVTLTAPDSVAVLPDTKNEVQDQHNDPMDISIKNTDNSKVTKPSAASSSPEKASDPSNIDNKPNTGSTSTNMDVSSSVVSPNAEKNEDTKLVENEVSNPSVGKGDKVEISSGLDQSKDQVGPGSPVQIIEDNVNSPLVGKADNVEAKGDTDNKPAEISKKNPQSDGMDYQDNDLESDEGRDGLLDTQGGDDIEDPMLTDGKPQEQSKANDHKEPSLSSFNREISQGDYYHTVQDGYSDGDDDHFFTFFLTAVVMAILLYVLYHNKNKVSKVFFGLLLEGRQSGKRRNSRGHAYRRLDTLEQAMSSNTTAAPPSKIIY